MIFCIYVDDDVESTREAIGAACLPRLSEYSHLERSLLSGLPNEVDFAINVCLLLSYDSKLAMRGSNGMRLVDCMLSNVGIHKEGKTTLTKLFNSVFYICLLLMVACCTIYVRIVSQYF